MINLNDSYVHEYTRSKYSPLFEKLPKDLFNIVLNFIEYDEVMDIYDDTDDEFITYHIYIPKKIYTKILYTGYDYVLYNVESL